MNDEALIQSKLLYSALLEHFEYSPLKIAIAFEFIHDGSDTKDRRKACARVGMWAHMGVPKKFAVKAAELLEM